MQEKMGMGNAELGETIMARYLKGNSDPDYFEQYIRFVKASGGEAVFVANILNGTVDELDEYLTRLGPSTSRLPRWSWASKCTWARRKRSAWTVTSSASSPISPCSGRSIPDVPIVAHSTPVGRAPELARASFHEWNQTLAKLPGISGFSQYGWTEFVGQARLQSRRRRDGPDARRASGGNTTSSCRHFPAGRSRPIRRIGAMTRKCI